MHSPHSKPAYSLIFAFVIMTVIMLIATTTIKNTTEKVAFYREMEGPVVAKLAAESAVENGIGQIRGSNAGFEPPYESGSFHVDDNKDGIYETYGDYTVYSKAQELDSAHGSFEWYTPMPGTGTAGDPDDCSIMNEDENADHPCNWNKLLYDQTVSIPLYSDDGSGGTLNPFDLGLDDWELRMRTPCADGDLDNETCVRFVMDERDSTGTFDEGGDSVVYWQLVGEKDSDGDGPALPTPVSLVPDDAYELSHGNIVRFEDFNTEIYESLFNTAADYIVLQAADTDPYKTIYSTCMEKTVTKLSLQLNIVSPLEDDSGGTIPYLEWQLVTHADEPFGDTKAVILGEGYHQGTEGIFYFPTVVTRSTTGENTSVYTLSN